MNEPADVRRVATVPEALTVEWADGGVSEFTSLWLRDNRGQDRDAHSGQRLIDILDVPETPRLRSATQRNGSLQVEWEGESQPASFELSWLAAHAAGRAPTRPELAVRLWPEGGKMDARRDFAWASVAALTDTALANREAGGLYRWEARFLSPDDQAELNHQLRTVHRRIQRPLAVLHPDRSSRTRRVAAPRRHGASRPTSHAACRRPPPRAPPHDAGASLRPRWRRYSPRR